MEVCTSYILPPAGTPTWLKGRLPPILWILKLRYVTVTDRQWTENDYGMPVLNPAKKIQHLDKF